MDVPDAVTDALGDESVAARVPLRGDDVLLVTPTRTLVYRADGLLSNESVTAYDHDAERVIASEGRRTATITLDYGLDGESSFDVPSRALDDVLHPVLAGVLNAGGVTDSGERVVRTYRFSELTLVVTSERLVRHVGGAVWDGDYEVIPYADVTDVTAEEGSVASQLVLETTGRTQRIKVPDERFRDVRETVETALFEAHGVADYDAFRRAVAPDEDDAPETTDDSDADPALAFDPDDAGASASDALDAATDPGPDVDFDALEADLEELRDALADQRERADAQRDAIERQRAALDAQLDLLDEQAERVDDLLETIRDR
ncbi:hypothetical protein GCM10009037_07780 [Halarchaeum grantii]|uniref:DUF7115 domain-containing protein n=1 Tax=Halarchaeum grantii TaxID=1193105 RepID=A0A830EUQ8_9EURY|nr:hypothetical protein [Halarchaeum grantii]GGL26577.1 hypothetical protein GCM10009037_07780 [Halarchaeum grantii]